MLANFSRFLLRAFAPFGLFRQRFVQPLDLLLHLIPAGLQFLRPGLNLGLLCGLIVSERLEFAPRLVEFASQLFAGLLVLRQARLEIEL